MFTVLISRRNFTAGSLAPACPLTRAVVGATFFWFGVLKFFTNLSPAQDLAGRTIDHPKFGQVPPRISLPVLATWECAIGIGLLLARGWLMRATLVLLALQLPGTFMPLVFFPAETWTHFPYAPTLEGQYVIKNLTQIAAGLLTGGMMHGGKVIADLRAAEQAERKQTAYHRFQCRF
jgi:hypothetical protein